MFENFNFGDNRGIIIIVTVIVLVLTLIYVLTKRTKKECKFDGLTRLKAGFEQPKFVNISEIEDVGEKKTLLTKIYSEEAVSKIIIYYASWCGACVHFLPQMKDVATILPTFAVEKEDVPEQYLQQITAFPTIMAQMSDGTLYRYSGPRSVTMMENLDESSIKSCYRFEKIGNWKSYSK